MEAVFLKILNMSITASWLVIAVIALRFLLKKAPKAFSVILWGLVGIRLVFPFSVESVLSLIPSAETVPTDIVYSPVPAIDSGIAALNSAVNPLISGTLAPNGISGAAPMETVTLIASTLWAAGAAAMLLYTVISYLLFRRKVREAAPLKDNIYLCDGIGTPFILGIIRPRIYLPSNISEADMHHVIAHERAHLKRRDHLWKPLGFLLLTVYWFNPVLWVAYILLCRDIELACDERVIKDKSVEIKKSYSEALVNCSVPRKMIAACPLAFGEGSVKGRIKSVLNYKKPAFWIIIVSVIACVAVAVCFLTNPITAKPKLPENFTLIDVGYNEHVSISVKEVVLDTDNPYIKIEWQNNTPAMLVYGEPFDIEYYDYKNPEEPVRSCKREDLAFALPAYYVKGGETSEHVYSLSGFDLSKDGVYVFSTDADYQYDNVKASSNFVVAFGIGDISEYEEILEDIFASEDGNSTTVNYDLTREKYPQYFDLDTKNGLEVYVWQMSEYSYYFGLMSGKDEAYSDYDLLTMSLNGATTDEMKTILSSYDIPENDIYVIEYQNPISSYVPEGIGSYASYMYKIYEMLGLKPPENKGNVAAPLELPTLTILYNEPVEAWIGAYKWHFGVSGLTYSNTIPILACIEDVDPIKVKEPQDSSGYSYGPYMDFEVKPDKVMVRCYDLDDEGRPLVAEYELGDDMTIRVNQGESRLYQIIATWSSYDEFKGTVEYAFCTE